MAGKLTDSKVARLCQVLIEDINSLTYSELQVFRETDEAKRLLKILLSRPTTVSNGDYTTEHFMCCGTTCDREAVKRYIERLEVVVDAAHHLEQSGVLADTPRMQNLKTALEELQGE